MFGFKFRPRLSRQICNALAGFACLSLLGCSDNDMSDLTKYINEVKIRPKSAIEPLPEIKVVEPFLFDTNGLRDPFVAINKSDQDVITDIANGTGIRPDPLHQKEELENYPLDALRMVGTVNVNSVLWGLITVKDDSNNDKGSNLTNIHKVQVGNYLGMHFGKITRISSDKIELTEIVEDKPGISWREQEQTLPLVLAE